MVELVSHKPLYNKTNKYIQGVRGHTPEEYNNATNPGLQIKKITTSFYSLIPFLHALPLCCLAMQ